MPRARPRSERDIERARQEEEARERQRIRDSAFMHEHIYLAVCREPIHVPVITKAKSWNHIPGAQVMLFNTCPMDLNNKYQYRRSHDVLEIQNTDSAGGLRVVYVEHEQDVSLILGMQGQSILPTRMNKMGINCVTRAFQQCDVCGGDCFSIKCQYCGAMCEDITKSVGKHLEAMTLTICDELEPIYRVG